jgi:hypothetical protein
MKEWDEQIEWTFSMHNLHYVLFLLLNIQSESLLSMFFLWMLANTSQITSVDNVCTLIFFSCKLCLNSTKYFLQASIVNYVFI